MTEQTLQSTSSSNDYYQTLSALTIRLDTRPILDDFELYLKGKRVIVSQNKDGSYNQAEVVTGEPKANNMGVQAILSRVAMLLNSAVVQGNWTEEKYNFEIGQLRHSLAKSIMINLYNWGIKEDDYMELIDTIMGTMKAFLSRLINNEERKGYSSNLRTDARIIEQQQPNRFFLGR